MIFSFTFSNSRSFRDSTEFSMEATSSQAKSENVTTLSLSSKEKRILKMALVYGSNASGKTNIFRTLHALCSEIRGESYTAGGKGLGSLYNPFCLDESFSIQPATIDLSFECNSIQYDYSLVFNSEVFLKESLYYYPKGVKCRLFSRDIHARGEMHGPQYPTTLSSSQLKPNFLVFPNRLLLSKFLFDTPHELVRPAAKFLAAIDFANNYSIGMKSRLFKDACEMLEKDNHYEQKLKRLFKYADLGISDFSFSQDEGRTRVYFQHIAKGDSPKSIEINEESLGTQYLFLLGPKILYSLENGTPLFIDEVDSGLHTKLTDFILKMYRSTIINPNNAQLVVVTHDVSLMNEDYLRRDQIWFTEKRDDGSSDLYSLSDFEDVREDTPYAKWYMANKFGAIPELKKVEELFGDVQERE